MVKVLGKINIEPQVPSTGISGQPSQQQQSNIPGLLRQVISPTLTAGETALGKLGDITQLVANVLLPGFEPEPGKPLQVPFSSQGLRKNVREPISKYLGIEQYTIPQYQLEERFNDFIGDTAAFLTGGPKDIRSALKVAGLGNLAGLAAHQFGATPKGEAGVKLGTMLLSSLHGGRSALAQQYENQYKNVQEGIKDLNLPAHKLEKDLADFIKKTKAGGLSSAKKEALEQAQHLGTQIEGAKIPAENIWQFKKDINQALFALKPNDPERKYLEQLIGIAKDNLKPIGSELYGQLASADEIFGSLAESRKLGNFVKKYINPNSIKNNYVKMALKGLSYAVPPAIGGAGYYTGGPVGLGLAGGLGSLGIAVNESVKFINLLNKSPQARKVYGDMLISGLQGNAGVFRKHLAKLDQVANNFDKKHPMEQKSSAQPRRALGKIKVQ